jgi:hypothetical protein
MTSFNSRACFISRDMKHGTQLTKAVEQSPSWGANRYWAGQEIPCILWNPNVHYHIHKRPPHSPFQSQISPLPPYSTSWSILILTCHLHLGLPSGVLPSGLPPPPRTCIHLSSPCTCRMPRPSHSSCFDHPNDVWWGVRIVQLVIFRSPSFPP